MTIRLILEPIVELVGRPSADREAIARWLRATAGTEWTAGGTGNDAEHLCEAGGRTCFWSFARKLDAQGRPVGRDTGPFFGNILKKKHVSILEHAQFSFLIAGVSRSLTHELVRHRHHSPSQLSQRYVDQCDPEVDLGLVVPVGMLEDHAEWLACKDGMTCLEPTPIAWQFEGWVQGQEAAIGRYRATLARQIARGRDRKKAHDLARYELPEACETRLMLSGNARAWMEAMTKRYSPAAADEIRRLFGVIDGLLAAEMPHVFGGERGEP